MTIFVFFFYVTAINVLLYLTKNNKCEYFTYEITWNYSLNGFILDFKTSGNI